MTTKRELQRSGFKPIPGMQNLYIDRAGQVYDHSRQRYIGTTAKHFFRWDGRYHSVPRIMLSVFKREPYQKHKHIHFIDGDCRNLHIDNICYTPERPDIKIDPDEFMTAIRCYFEVTKRYKINDNFQTRLYLQGIVRSRYFDIDNSKAPGIDLFMSYIENPMLSKASAGEMYGFTVKQSTDIINPLLKKLIAEILQDMEAGYLSVKDYKPRLQAQTLSGIIKRVNENRIAAGMQPIKISKQSPVDRYLSMIRELRKEYENNPE